MARVFDGFDQYLSLAAKTADNPFTVSLWFNTDVTNRFQVLFEQQNALHTHYYDLAISGPTVNRLEFAVGDGTFFGGVNTTNTYSTNVWQHAYCCIGFTSAMRVALNGGALSGAGPIKSPTLTRTRIAAATVGIGDVNDGFSGKIAEIGVWNVSLEEVDTDARLALAAGYSPLHIMNGNLIRYIPLLNAEDFDYVNSTQYVDNNSPTTGRHCPIMHPKRNKKIIKPFKLPLDWFNPGEEVDESYEVNAYG